MFSFSAGSWPTCTVDTSARDIAITMREHKTGFLVVTGTEKDSFDLQGILTVHPFNSYLQRERHIFIPN